MQIDRLFQIVYLLLDRKTMTAKELAAHFEVSVRTILRDIDTLSSASVPIYTIQGKGGGISLLDGYVLNKAALSQAEQNQILIALQILAAAGNTDVKERSQSWDIISKDGYGLASGRFLPMGTRRTG